MNNFQQAWGAQTFDEVADTTTLDAGPFSPEEIKANRDRLEAVRRERARLRALDPRVRDDEGASR